jgi:hypothetical protein
MIVKSATIKLNDDGSFSFITSREEESFKRTISALTKKGTFKAELTLNLIYEESTQRQCNLFKMICRKISEASAMYDYNIVYSSILQYFGYNNIEDFPKDKFNDLLEISIMTAREAFGVEIKINPENHHVEIL